MNRRDLLGGIAALGAAAAAPIATPPPVNAYPAPVNATPVPPAPGSLPFVVVAERPHTALSGIAAQVEHLQARLIEMNARTDVSEEAYGAVHDGWWTPPRLAEGIPAQAAASTLKLLPPW